MEAIKCIKERRSIRKFTEKEITEDILKEVIEAASYAPSWKNTQISRYTMIRDVAKKSDIAEKATMSFSHNGSIIKHCNVLVVLSYKNGRCGYEKDGSFTTSKGDRWQMFDAGIATQTFCLAAWEKGIGSVIMGIFDENKVAEAVHLPEDETVAALIAIGYPAEEPIAPKRKDVDEILRVL